MIEKRLTEIRNELAALTWPLTAMLQSRKLKRDTLVELVEGLKSLTAKVERLIADTDRKR